MPVDRRFRLILATLLLALLSFSWLGAQLYQSHYVSGLRVLGDPGAEALLGEPKEGRGDEWSTYLPLLKQAQGEGFPARSSLEPYRERFDWFITLPHADASLLLLPNQAAWWVMPPGMALSFQGLYYNLLLLLSMFWLLCNLRVGLGLALAAGVVLLFSHLYQVWWTSNFACLGASILPFAVITSSLRWRWRAPLLAWSIAHMLLGQLYPPFYFSLAVAVLPFIAAAKPDLLQWRSLACGVASVAVGCAAVLYFKLDYVEAVAATTYPGSRFSIGGDVSPSTLLAVLFPTWPATPDPGVGLAFYELGVAASFFPLLAIAALPTVEWTREVRRVVAVSLLVGLVLAVYMVSGFPPRLATATGFSMAPGRRIQLGFSVLALLLSVWLLSRQRAPIRVVPLIAVFAAYALVTLCVGVLPDADGRFQWFDWYPWLALGLLCVAGLAAWWSGHRRDAGQAMAAALVCGMAFVHVLVFGAFNPLMRASDIMRPVDTQLVRDWKALHRMNQEQPLALIGNYGHLLRGEGLEALQAIHLSSTDEDIYARVFPEIPAPARHGMFNQFLGIKFDNVGRYDKTGLAATFPARLHSVAFPHGVEGPRSDALPIATPAEAGEVVRRGAGAYAVYWKAMLHRPWPIDAALVVHAGCSVQSSWLTRYPTGGALVADGGTSLRGIAGELVVAAGSAEEAAACARSIVVSSPQGATVVVPQPMDAGVAAIRDGLEWSGKACDLAVQEEQDVRRDQPSLLHGYAIAPSGAPPDAFEIVLAGARAYSIAATTGIDRPDVASYFDDPRLARSGFRVGVNYSGLEPGRYAVEFHGMQDGRGWFCESGKTLVVLP